MLTLCYCCFLSIIGMPPQMSGPPRFPPPPGGMMPPPGAFPPGNTSGSPSEAMQNKK